MVCWFPALVAVHYGGEFSVSVWPGHCLFSVQSLRGEVQDFLSLGVNDVL